MDKNKALESVTEIKELMEKSSKFVSLSGITAVMAGVYSFVGAYVVGRVFNSEASFGGDGCCGFAGTDGLGYYGLCAFRI